MSMITPLLVGYASKYEVEVYRELNDCKFGLLLYEYCTKSAMGALKTSVIVWYSLLYTVLSLQYTILSVQLDLYEYSSQVRSHAASCSGLALRTCLTTDLLPV